MFVVGGFFVCFFWGGVVAFVCVYVFNSKTVSLFFIYFCLRVIFICFCVWAFFVLFWGWGWGLVFFV